jgi:hypothetical protein
MKRVACIGKKETSPEEQNLLIRIGGWLALQGFTVSSGNAAGSERFFALGASMVNPRLVELHLPWEGYNPEFIFPLNEVIVAPDTHERQMLVKRLHPKPDTLNDRTVRLHCRNIGIIEGTEFVIALPNWDKPDGGGTGMGLKVAEHFGIRIFDLSKEEDRQRILAKIDNLPHPGKDLATTRR